MAPFDWDEVLPREYFDWHPCFGDFKCARLRVPMDWHGNTTEATQHVDIAVIKVEATVPATHSGYGGAVVLNPGGPGGSGVDLVLKGGYDFRNLLSAGRKDKGGASKHFDIISFDPRAVNNTRPHISCFPDHLAAAAFQIEQSAYGWLDTSDVAFDNIWASKRAVAEGCSRRAAEQGIGKHASTAAVARDVIEIFEQHGKWREKEVARLLQERKVSAKEAVAIGDRTKYCAGTEMVQYWGLSYGTLLGGTIAAMYPDRIKRAVLDGVVDGDDYMSALWSANLQDLDQLLPLMAEYCFEGGPTKCALYDQSGPAAISETIRTTMSSLRRNPISVPANGTRGPVLVTQPDLQRVFRDNVYNPLNKFTAAAEIIAELSRGQAFKLAERKTSLSPELGKPLDKACNKDGPFSWACVKSLIASGSDLGGPDATACSDGLDRTGESKEEFRESAQIIVEQSELVGADWATIMAPCTAWYARPAWRYNGNFTYKPAHPVLFVGNTVDPATPLRNAFKMAARCEGSQVLQHNATGHCSLASPSMCTGRAIRDYFQTGNLPAVLSGGVHSFCDADRLPFDGFAVEKNPALPTGETDEEMWKALVALSRI